MSIIRISKQPNQFSIIDHTIVKDPRLSFKAKGIICYILTKPDDWTINVTDLINQSSDSRTAIMSGLRELEKYGYISSQREEQ